MSSEPAPADPVVPPAAPPPPAPRRLHPAGIAVLAADSARQAVLPLAIFVGATLFGGGMDVQGLARALFFALAATVGAVVVGYVRWRSTTYAVTGDAIAYRTGVLSRRESSVPLRRVQALDTVQGLVQRLFGVSAVHVQAAGGDREGEVVLSAVAPADVAELRAAVAAAGARPADGAPSEEPAPDPVVERLELTRGRLLAVAATQGQIAVVLPVLAAGFQILRELLSDRDLARATGLVPDTAGEVALAVAALVVAGWLLSAIGALLTFGGFTLEREPARLRIARGLLQRREAIVPVARVQAVRVVEGLLREPFGLATLRVEVAGYAKEGASAQTIFPLVRRAEVEPLLKRMLPELAAAPEPLAPVPARSLRRFLVWPLLVAVPLAAAGWAASPAAGPFLLALPLAAAWLGVARYRAAGWRLQDGRLALRFRRLARITILAPGRRVQEQELTQTPFQRRARLVSLEVALGAGTRARVAHLDRTAADGLFAALAPLSRRPQG